MEPWNRGTLEPLEPFVSLMTTAGRLARRLVVTAITLSILPAAAHVAAPPPGSGQQPAADAPVDYAREIQPVLERECYECHGPRKVRGSLRLDRRDRARRGGMSGPAVVPGDSEHSVLVRRLLGLDGEDRMPLEKDPLPEAEIATIRRWIEQGAPWPEAGVVPVASHEDTADHWAYVAPRRREPPAVRAPGWVRTPIDRFVLARLEREGLRPSPEASKESLLRRVSLDLIGLPPTIAEMDAFLADGEPGAYERVVERLLASPHYGERWARVWLDLARYADSNGFEKDRPRVMWKYRDWVIDALNRDMPFDRFTIEQMAGDMLPSATPAQRIATGFHRNTMLNQEGGIDIEEARWETLVDRVNTTSTVWLGSTIACAQCHNHKFDPFSQRDYYRLLAFFDNAEYTSDGQGVDRWIVEPELPLPSEEQAGKETALRSERDVLKQRLQAPDPALETAQQLWEREVQETERDWTVLAPARVTGRGGVVLTTQPDGSMLAGGPNPSVQDYTIATSVPEARITAIRLEALPDPSLPQGGPGRDYYGNFVLTGIQVETGGNAPIVVSLARIGTDDSIWGHDGKDLLKAGYEAVTRDLPPGWAIDATRDPVRLRRQAVIVFPQPVSAPPGTPLTVTLSSHGTAMGQAIGRFRLSSTASAEPLTIVAIRPRTRLALETPAAERTDDQRKELTAQFRRQTPLLAGVRDRIEAIEKAIGDLGIVSALVLRERTSHERPSTFLRERGSFLAKGERVSAGTPAILPNLPEDAMPNRLGLAMWLVDAGNPLTARVTVNRAWEQFFGRGLVETSEDFGAQGSPPTHPELLDWLALELIEQKWSLKSLHRLIVSSAAYRQAASVTPPLLEKDPYNRLLARGPRFRLDAEAIRDVTLAAGGLLSPKIGGPSVFPLQPPGIWDNPYSDAKWETSEGEDRYRRGLYTFVRRTSPYPSALTLDATSREFCTVRRVRTNTPLQALTLLNDEAYFEAARALADRMMREGGNDARGRAAYGLRLCTSRMPTRTEVERVLASYEKLRRRYSARPDGAAAVAGAGPGAPDAAAWILVANALLNLDESMTK